MALTKVDVKKIKTVYKNWLFT